MAKRKSFNRISRRYSKRRSTDSFGSGHLDPDTDIVDEERTFYWQNLEDTPPHSRIYNENETVRQLSANSRIDSSQGSVATGWWKNLDSDNEPIASTSSRHNAAIVKRNILQTSTSQSESEKELDLRKRKVRLKASNRKSINNAFANALNDDIEAIPLKLRLKQLHSERVSDSESSQGRSEQNEEDSNSSPTSKILKSKPNIFRTRRGGGGDRKDQNAFQNVLSEDDVLKGSTAKTSVAFEKESSQRSMHRNINTSKDHIVDLRELRAENIEIDSLTPNVEKVVPENNAEFVESSNESIVINRQHLKFKSRFIQQARKSIGKNAFADALIDDSNASLSTSDPNKENSIHRFSMSRSSPLRRSKANDIIPESSTIRKSPRSSLNIAKKQQSDISVQDKDNIETSLSSSSLDNNESRGTKKSMFFKPKSRILKRFRKHSTNPFEEIFKQGNINDRRNNVSTEDNRAFERETITKINQEHKSLAAQKNPQSEKSNTTNEEDSYEISLEVSLNVEKSRSNILPEDENKILENSDLNNASKSISRKSVIAESSEEKISSRKSIREKTSKEPAHANAILPVGRLSTNEIVIQNVSDDADVDVEHDVSTSESSSDKESRLTHNSLRNRSETAMNIEVHEVNNLHNASREHDSNTLKRLSKLIPTKEARLTHNSSRTRSETPVNIEIHHVNDNLHNDANKEHDSSMLKQSSKLSPSKESRLMRNSLRFRSETPKPANIEAHEDINNSRNDVDKEHGSNIFNRSSQLSPNKKTRLTRNSLRTRSETPVNIEVCEANDNLYNASREHDSSTLKRSSKLSPSKEARLTRNSLRNPSETPMNIEVRESNDNLYNVSREHDSSMLERSSKLSPSKEARLMHNSLRSRSETPKPANIEAHEDINNSRNDVDKEHDSNIFNRLSQLSPNKETRLTRNSLRTRSETPVNIEVREANDNLHNASREHDSSTLKQSSKLSPSKEARLTRNSLRNPSETPMNIEVRESNDNLYNVSREHDSSMLKRSSKLSPSKEARLTRNSLRTRSETPVNIEVREANDNLYNASREHDSSTLKRSSKLSPSKEARLTRNGPRNQSETLKPTSKNIEVSKRSMNLIADIEEDNNVNVDSETSSSVSYIITRADIHSTDNTIIGTQKNTILSSEKEMIDDEDAESAIQAIQRNSLTKPRISKTVNRQSVQSSNRTSIKDREITHRQKSLSKSRNTPTKSSSKDISSNKQSSSKVLKKIDDFFKIKETSTKQLSESLQKSQVFNSEKMKKIKMELEKLKSREMAAMKINPTNKKESAVKKERVKFVTIPKQDTKKKKPLTNSMVVVNKAFLVNGEIYRPPRLPRPKHWATDRLYKFLWKRLESKYKLATRVKSEKFVQELAKVVAIIERCKSYENYKTELKALMKEMARLELINTRMDFYHFCQEFLPYEFRVKVIPMLLPGNKSNIPFDPANVHTPLLETE